ncbi:MAG: SDR family oxidoreductase [Syntrophobacteraceae bacterium]
MKLSFRGSRVLLVGGSCDLALCVAELLLAEGLRPILTWRSEKGGNKIRRRLSSFEGRFETIHLDLTRMDSINSLFAEMNDDLDYLVDFAQGDMESLVAAADPGLVQGYFTENVSFRAELLRRAARAMLRKRLGRMVFISSAAAARSNPGQGFYTAAKLASESLYRNLGIELAGRGITTVTLRPGYVDAGRGARYIESHPDAAARTPIGRTITAGEVAGAVVFLLSDGAAAFNATEICMDGGLTASK